MTTGKSNREKVRERDGGACRLCGASDEGGRDVRVAQLIPSDEGGDDSMRNLFTVCEPCEETLDATDVSVRRQLAEGEKYRAALKDVKVMKDATYQGAVDIENALLGFLDGHPIFEEEIGAVRRDGVDTVRRLDAGVTPRGNADIDSEWQFAAAWGYKEGLLDAMNRIEGRGKLGALSTTGESGE